MCRSRYNSSLDKREALHPLSFEISSSSHQVAPNKLTFFYFEKVVLLTLFLASSIHQAKTVIRTVYWISRALWPMAPSLLLGRPASAGSVLPASHILAGRPVDEWTFNSTPFHLF
jgi:hypothetical protein